MMTFGEDLPNLIAQCDEFAVINRKKAARNLSNAEVFLIPARGTAKAYPIYWLLHVRGKGKSFADSKRSNQNLNTHRQELSDMGYVELTPDDDGFAEGWKLLISACEELGTKPSNRTRGPNWLNRRIFFPRLTFLDEAFSPHELVNSEHVDGAVSQITSNRYERKPANRRACIAHHLTKDNRILCKVCKIDFEERYGVIGRGYIHIHHVHPLGNKQPPQDFDPTVHLKPLCPNCHAMVHRLPDVENGIETLCSIIEEQNTRLRDA